MPTLAHRVEAELGAALAPLNLTVARLALLGHIASVPGASFSDLARRGAISVQGVHTAVKAMVAGSLVRDRTARAGSASTIELTAAGRRIMQSVCMIRSDPVLEGAAAALEAFFMPDKILYKVLDLVAYRLSRPLAM
ncbi:MAG: winged helix-turn-helix transcriptional regulator [Nocardia sp.]|uniref:MarR family winged helix-turn-helix transcriptional regulator n=1 Tax=Nocardia sp. TaxID=1821 RepID=UPI00260E4968|nr:MarR family winged helix-turn-helix transcriptional regulator [Nocardia sp.]MCU1643360.1 winged helix-turn-helix transcriptional regulator [Nocardia sp.]